MHNGRSGQHFLPSPHSHPILAPIRPLPSSTYNAVNPPVGAATPEGPAGIVPLGTIVGRANVGMPVPGAPLTVGNGKKENAGWPLLNWALRRAISKPDIPVAAALPAPAPVGTEMLREEPEPEPRPEPELDPRPPDGRAEPEPEPIPPDGSAIPEPKPVSRPVGRDDPDPAPRPPVGSAAPESDPKPPAGKEKPEPEPEPKPVGEDPLPPAAPVGKEKLGIENAGSPVIAPPN